MRILFDQGTPAPLRLYLSEHEVRTAFELGWNQLTNGDLLRSAEAEGFDVLVTTDQQLKFQQKLSARSIGILVLTTTNWLLLKGYIESLVSAIESIAPSEYREWRLPGNS